MDAVHRVMRSGQRLSGEGSKEEALLELSEAMTSDVITVTPERTLRRAGRG